MTLDDYLDKAKARQNLQSDRELSTRLGAVATHVNQYRRFNSLPSVERMIRIAELAGEPVEVAVMDLLIWKSPEDSPATLQVLTRMRAAMVKMFRAAAPALAVLAAVLVGFSSIDAKALELGRTLERAVAAERQANSPARHAPGLYIMGNIRRVLAALFMPQAAGNPA